MVAPVPLRPGRVRPQQVVGGHHRDSAQNGRDNEDATPAHQAHDHPAKRRSGHGPGADRAHLKPQGLATL